MIDIYTHDVNLYGVNMTVSYMDKIMNDNIIDGDYFIPFKFYNGKCGAVKKSMICAFTDHMEDD